MRTWQPIFVVYRIHKFKVSATEKLILDRNDLMNLKEYSIWSLQSSNGIQSEVHLWTAHIIYN